MLNWYDILEVPSTASWETIKQSYQTKVRHLHPDKQQQCRVHQDHNHKDDDDNEMVAFLNVQAAWECLRDPVSKKEYDAELAKQQTQTSKSQPVSLATDCELIEDEDSGELSYVYMCRCGEELWLSESTFQATSNSSSNNKPLVYATCSGCSLVYHVLDY